MRFRTRSEAGRALAALLGPFDTDNPIVLGASRGGVVVAREVAAVLGAPLDVVLVRPVRAPGHPETTIGAVAEDDVVVTDQPAMHRLGITLAQLATALDRGRTELAAMVRAYRPAVPGLAVGGRTVLLVDDGIEASAAALAAVRVLRGRGAARIVLAVPAGPTGALDRVAHHVDRTVCLRPLRWNHSLDFSYTDLAPVDDAATLRLLAGATRPVGTP